MGNNGEYTKRDLKKRIVKKAEALDLQQTEKDLEKMVQGRQAGFGKADCENIVESQKKNG